MADRFFDLIPEQHLSLMGLSDGPAKTAALEQAYTDGFVGCFTPDMDGPMGRAARYYADEFADTLGKDSYRFEDLALYTFADDTEFGYVASMDAAEQWKLGRDANAVDWLFAIFQNWGDCVNASQVELYHGMIGTRAADPQNNEVYRWLPCWYEYAFRGSCGHGWYTSKAASVAMEHGYCYALPDVAGVRTLSEQEGETLVAQAWCRSGPPSAVREFVRSKGWQFPQGSITRLSGGIDGLKDVFRAKGQIHHGSNATSGSSKPNVIKRIGGHAQTAFGGDWSERTLRFFADKGITYTTDNFPVVNHQTWGGSWSGAVSDSYWPDWWGPKPQGAWICSASQFLSNFNSSAYVYLPSGMKGWPGEGPTPPPPSETICLTGRLTADNGGPIRGTLVAETADSKTRYIIVPDGSGGYIPARNPF